MRQLKCPRCAEALTPVRIGGVDTDVCERCGGLWLDRNELARFDPPDVAFGDALVAHLQQFPASLMDHSLRLRCPHHDDVVMARRPYSGFSDLFRGIVHFGNDDASRVSDATEAADTGGERI